MTEYTSIPCIKLPRIGKSHPSKHVWANLERILCNTILPLNIVKWEWGGMLYEIVPTFFCTGFKVF